MEAFARFVGLFSSLRERCGNAPGGLILLADNDKSAAKLAFEICKAADQAKRALAMHDRRYILNAPPEFLTAFENWNRHWSQIATEASMGERVREEARALELAKEILAQIPAETASEIVEEFARKRNPYHPFDPSADDPPNCILHAFGTASDFANASPSFFNIDRDIPYWISSRHSNGGPEFVSSRFRSTCRMRTDFLSLHRYTI